MAAGHHEFPWHSTLGMISRSFDETPGPAAGITSGRHRCREFFNRVHSGGCTSIRIQQKLFLSTGAALQVLRSLLSLLELFEMGCGTHGFARH
jgi:hypothetical protein